MTADFRLIVQTAERHAHILAVHGLGYASSQTGLSYSRRTVEAEDRTLRSVFQRSNCQIFQDALLHFLHAVVVLVENLLGVGQAQVVYGVFVPRQIYQRLQIVDLNRIVGALRIDVVKLGHLLLENRLGCSVPYFVLGLFEQFLLLRTSFPFSQFSLDLLNLLFQEVFLLLFFHLVLSLSPDF